MTENVCNLLDNLTKHNSKQYGYELSQREISQILKLFDDVKRLEEFEAIGTIEEFKALKEKSMAKKPTRKPNIGWTYEEVVCPTCGKYISSAYTDNYCKCGQKLDWSE